MTIVTNRKKFSSLSEKRKKESTAEIFDWKGSLKEGLLLHWSYIAR
jgi:hypothetical protein